MVRSKRTLRMSVEIRGLKAWYSTEEIAHLYKDPEFLKAFLDKIGDELVRRGKKKLLTYRASVEATRKKAIADQRSGKAYSYPPISAGRLYRGINHTKAEKVGKGAEMHFYAKAPYSRQFELGIGHHSAQGPRPFMRPAVTQVMYTHKELLMAIVKDYTKKQQAKLRSARRSLWRA